MNHIEIEEAFASECTKQRVRPSATAVMELAIAYAGSTLKADYIILPTGHSIHIRDAVNSLRSAMPDQFLAPHPDGRANELPAGATLTEQMRHELRARRSGVMPDGWSQTRAKMTGVTAAHMDEMAAKRMGL